MEIEALVQKIVDEVKGIEGVSAVVLGGSRARGTNMPSSDIDLGIYYHPGRSLNLNELSMEGLRLFINQVIHMGLFPLFIWLK